MDGVDQTSGCSPPGTVAKAVVGGSPAGGGMGAVGIAAVLEKAGGSTLPGLPGLPGRADLLEPAELTEPSCPLGAADPEARVAPPAGRAGARRSGARIVPMIPDRRRRRCPDRVFPVGVDGRGGCVGPGPNPEARLETTTKRIAPISSTTINVMGTTELSMASVPHVWVFRSR